MPKQPKVITLATLPTATEQEVFDHVAYHLLTQNEPAMDGKFCVYRTDDGKKCAAGCLIAPLEYDRDWEARAWDTLVDHGKVPCEHEVLIADLQSQHDKAAHLTVDEWRDDLPRRLREIAHAYALNTNVIDALRPAGTA